MSAEGTKMPEPAAFYETEGDEWHIYPRGTSTYEHIRDHQKDRIGVHVFALYTPAQLQEATRLAMERAIEACDDVEEPAWYDYENPNTFDDGKRACIAAIRALADVDAKEKGNG